MGDNLTHLNSDGSANMVDVSDKPSTSRIAIAVSSVIMDSSTLDLIQKGNAKKGDVIGTAKLAGIMAAKRTHELIPLCHSLALSKVEVVIEPDMELPGLQIRATAKVTGQTGVEMEALTAASVAALTIYDMAKAVDRGMVIGSTRLAHKSGGKSGEWNIEASQ